MSLNTTAVRIKVTLKDVNPTVMRCLVAHSRDGDQVFQPMVITDSR